MKAFIATLILSTLVLAAPNGPISFDTYDTNKDGIISSEEFDTAKADRMSKNAEEGKQLRNAGNSPIFSDFDADGDGKVTKYELREGQQAHREKMMKQNKNQKQYKKMNQKGKGKNW